jgi:hypothetical protein
MFVRVHFADVYDCPWWKELLGAVSPGRITRIGLLLCLDAVPAFNQKRKGSPSLMPTELVILSLPPHMRYDPDNMLTWALIPADMSAEAQLKYWQHLIEKELNPIQIKGVPGPDGPVKVKLFGASLDLKGKEKFYNQVRHYSLTIC